MNKLGDRAVVDLGSLADEEGRCRRCDLYRHATQVVPGEGPTRAQLMFVGEQPGSEEDLAGLPFVGPAGRILDRAVAAAGIDRRRTFVTNAVKHFKFEPRGKRRLHKRPSAYEIDRCRWWLDRERAIIRPEIIVALGVSAARAVLGRAVVIAQVRGQFLIQDDGSRTLVTIHPSYLLRIREEADRTAEYERFVGDLRLCADALEVSQRQ